MLDFYIFMQILCNFAFLYHIFALHKKQRELERRHVRSTQRLYGAIAHFGSKR